MPVYVTEEEEQSLKNPVQTLFFGVTDRLKRAEGTADREAVMAMIAQGLGQALVEAGEVNAAPEWVDAFFTHLAEVGVKVKRASLKPTKTTFPKVAGLMRDFRKEEEWFFPGGWADKLKVYLVASFRVVPSMRPQVKPERAVALFLEHVERGLQSKPLKGRPSPAAGKKKAKKTSTSRKR